MQFPFNILLILAESITAIYIYDTIFERSLNGKAFTFLAIAKCCFAYPVPTIMLLIPYASLRSTAFELTFILILWFFVVELSYKGKMLKKIIATVIVTTCMSLFDIIIYLIFCNALGADFNDTLKYFSQYLYMPYDNITHKNIIIVFLSLFVSKTLLFTIGYFIKQIYKEKAKFTGANKWVWCFVAFLPVFTICSLSFFIKTFYDYNILRDYIFTIGLVLFALNAIFMFLLGRISKEQKLLTQNIVYEQEIKNRTETVQIWVNAFDKQRRLTHDFNHHISVINTFLQAEQISEMKDYLNKLSLNLTGGTVIDTNNAIINAVINQKYWQAKEKSICMRFVINDLVKFPLQSADLVTVLANLLDNAIDAAEKVDDEKQIVVKLWQENKKAVISVRNTSNYAHIHENSIQSTKNDNTASGFGLINIKNVLDKHGAIYTLQFKDGWFQFTAVLLNINV